MDWTFVLPCLLLATAAGAQSVSLRADFSKPGKRVSPLLYGIFFEEINHAGDGGLYAELVRNGSFEEGEKASAWSLQTDGAEGDFSTDTQNPFRAQAPNSLRLEFRSGKGRVGASNAGYWGIPIVKGAQYKVAMMVRCSKGYAGQIHITLLGAAGNVLCGAETRKPRTEWHTLSETIRAREGDEKATLLISMDAPGTLWLDNVSLMPKDTWKGGVLRKDLAEMLADLKPAFVRFPGGCFCEGDRLANAFRWKKTIGPTAERPGHWNLWGYHSTDGLGYHEYLQMCEDLRSEPLFVINCGMAHENVAPMSDLDEWVQDALDAIEYANGPVSSRWGALRAKNGHPKPFRLKYLEIGNENGGPAYEERYARFWDAIKAKYPDIKLIANVPVKSWPMDILDEHYYNTPEWFAAQAAMHDGYDRTGPKVYVGEYAVTQGCGTGNLRAAVAEAAYMTGLERNADHVIMASYAPLFVNVNDRKWNPDAICFDGLRAYGTPSYWVQQMFSSNRVEEVFPLRIRQAARTAVAQRGGVGVGTWATQAEYKDLQVSAGPTGDWRVVHGTWANVDGAYRQTSGETDCRAVTGDPSWSDYTLTLKARLLDGAEGFLILFRVRDDDNWYWWNIGGWGNTRNAIERCVAGVKHIVAESVPGGIAGGPWHDIRIELTGARIRCYLNNKLIHDVEETEPVAISACVGRVGGDVVLKVANTSGTAEECEVEMAGLSSVSAEGTEVRLTSDFPNDENSFDAPRRVSPVKRKVSGLGKSFRYTFPAHSVTILRMKGE